MRWPELRRKVTLLAAAAAREPREAARRVATVFEVQLDRWMAHRTTYLPTGWNEVSGRLELRDDGGQEAEASIVERLEKQVGNPFKPEHAGDMLFGRALYAIVRTFRPHVVVETGVAHGISSAFVLAAMRRNDDGHLYSIDLPPLADDADAWVGASIPEAWRDRWTLKRGSSRRLLPALLDAVAPVDVFIHDSLHTYRTMRWELAQGWRHLREGSGLLVCDDVSGNAAFGETAAAATRWWVVREGAKDTMFGVAVK